MTELSGRGRALRRGATLQGEFLAAMQAAGFTAIEPPRPGFLHEFVHADTGARRYCMAFGDSYTRALARLTGELASGRHYAPPV